MSARSLLRRRSPVSCRAKSLRSEDYRSRRRALLIEPLEKRLLLTRNFLESEPVNDTFPGQSVEHFPPAELGVVDIMTPASAPGVAAIPDGDQDFFVASAAVDGDLNINVLHLGGDPSSDGGGDDLQIRLLDAGGSTITTLALNDIGDMQSFGLAGAAAGDQIRFVVEGVSATDDAEYRLRMTNVDREDNIGNNNRRSTATDLGAVSTIDPADLVGYTITNPDRDYFKITADMDGPITVNVVMPSGSGAQTGANGPTNLGVRIRDSNGELITTSGGTQSDVDSISFESDSGEMYFIEVYSGSVGQVNRYDLEIVKEAGDLSGFKFEDLNGDGLRGIDESPLAGWTINLDLNDDGSIDQTTTTDANGFYQFSAVPSGRHQVTETMRPGFVQTLPGVEDNFEYIVNVGPHELIWDHLDFGNEPHSSIHGRKFKDLNGNGAFDAGEHYLNGWQVILFDEAGRPVDSQVTHDHDIDQDGRIDPLTERGWYWFDDLQPGHYTVGEILPPDDHWLQTFPMAPHSDGLLDPGFDLFMTDPGSTVVDLSSFLGQTLQVQLQGVPFGPGGTDTIVERLDAADVQNIGDAATVPIELVALQLQSVQPIDLGGELFVLDVFAGREFGVPQEQGQMTIHRDHEFGGSFSAQLPVVAELVFTSIDNPSSPPIIQTFNDLFLSDSVWSTAPSAGDPRIVDEQLNQLRPAGGFHPGVDHQGICPGVKVLTEEQAMLAAHGVLPAMLREAVSPGVHRVWLDSGQRIEDIDFGNTKKGSIHGYKFEDLDADGIDDSEPRLAGVVYTLTGIDGMGNPVGPIVTTTDANGEFWFEKLKPGVYTVTETVPAGFTPSTPTQVTVTVSAGQEYVGEDGQSRHLKELQTLRPTYVPGDGYLEFINPTEHPGLIGTPVPTSPPGVIMTEEYTGFTLANGTDVIELGDSDTTAGDQADFDWVQEHRGDEGGPLGNHPFTTGALGWVSGTPETSLHIDPGGGVPHSHSDEEIPPGPLPHLENEAYSEQFFAAVDVFSIISINEDRDTDASGALSRREAALDYVVDFVNTATGAFSPGVLTKVWIPGWTGATTIDDYVARWVPTISGMYDVVAVEPASGPFDDQVTEIDAIKALPHAKEEIVLRELAFGNFQSSSIHGRKFKDLNGNGAFDAGEHYLNGWQVILFDEAGRPVDSQVTHDHDIDQDGRIDPLTERGWYWFDDLQPGHYTVGEILPPDDHWLQTFPMAPHSDGLLDPGFDLFMTDPGSTVVDLSSFLGQTLQVQLQGVPFGPGGTDTIVQRLDAADVQNIGDAATVPIELVALQLQSVQPIDLGGELFVLDVFAGREFGVPQEQGQMTIHRDHEFGGSFSAQLPVVAELVFTSIDNPSSPPIIQTFNDLFLSDSVWSTAPSAGDPRIVDEQLNQMRPAGGFHPGVDHQGICPGVKVLTEEQAMLAAHGVLPAMLREAVSPGVHRVWLDSGQRIEDIDFGNTKKGSIHGYKFEDLDADGIDDSEPRLAGVVYTLTGIDGMGNPVGPIVTTTDANGEFWFEKLKPGVYTVTETVPAGFTPSTPTQVTVTVSAGQEYVGEDGQSRHLKELQTLRPTYVPGDGYLEFINPTEHPGLIGTPVPTSPPGVIMTEEYTGFTLANGTDVIELGDSDTTAGDQADFDWVQEHRGDEGGPLGNHPFTTGALGWVSGTPETSLHIDPGGGVPHSHSDEEIPPGPLPHLENEAYSEQFFAAVDVFSIISINEDRDTDASGALSRREAALDYVVDFVNTATGAFSPGVLTKVWIPGWTGATTIDDYVARWVPTISGMYDVVAVEPASGPFDDQVTEIDAIKALPHAKEEIVLRELAFGNVPQSQGAFNGLKFNDRNENGIRDANDEPRQGFRIELFRDVDGDGVFEPNGPFGVPGDDGDPIVTTVTNATGLYRLGSPSLPSDTYFIREVPRQGWRQTAPSSPNFHTVNYVTGNSIAGLDFGNVACGAIHLVGDGLQTVTSERVGILSLVLSQGTFSVSRNGGGAFDAYDGVGSLLAGQSSVSSYTDTDGRERVDILIDGTGTPALTQFDVTISGSGGAATLDVVNAVNVDIGGSLALIIQGSACGDMIVVGDDEGGPLSDAKAIFVGAVIGALNGGSDLTASGVHYRTAIMDAMFGQPAISRIEIDGRDGDDVIRVKDDIIQQSILRGGAGNDNVRAGSGKGTLLGEAGHDLLIGGGADDVFNGGEGDDRIYGGAGADRAFGGNGDDWIGGGDSNDPLLRGGAGNDAISGGTGRDRLLGDSGFDTLYRDRFDLLVSVGGGGGVINNVPPDPVDQALRELIDNNWLDSFVLNENADGLDNDFDGLIDEADEVADDDAALDTLDELINSILP